MTSITLVRMGMDFYNETDKQASDMENFRLRPKLDNQMPGVDDCYLKDKNGHYIVGDFQFLRADQYGVHADRLRIDFTDYGTDMKDSKVYKYNIFDDVEEIAPTLENIKAWLESVLGDEVDLHLEPAKEDEE